MSKYMMRVYDSAENCYLGGFKIYHDSLNDAMQAAIELTKRFVELHIDYLEVDVFMYCTSHGRGEYQLIGYVSYDCETWDVESIEFEECFC